MNYGEKISRLRKAKGMTQEELGKVLNVTYQAVSKWERGESLPDFATMSQMAKFFQVPLEYFEDGGELQQETANASAVSAMDNYIGMCTVCGKMLKEEETYTTTPKIVCKSCAERQKQEELRKNKEAEEALKRKKEREAQIQRGGGFDVKLIICLILALAGFVTFAVLCFTCNQEDREMYATFLVIAPLALFACPTAVFDLIDDLRDNDDGPEGYTRNLSLVIGAVFAVISLALCIVLYCSFGNQPYYLVLMALGTVLSFTFISQFMWGSVVKEIFTCGGFTFKLPGFIFSLTPDSIILMIITKVFLGILSILVFIATTVLFALVAIFGSVFTFIPCVIYKTVKDKNA